MKTPNENVKVSFYLKKNVSRNELCPVIRTLKTDLDLRPIYHKKDDVTMAHLHLGLLAYWVVNCTNRNFKKWIILIYTFFRLDGLQCGLKPAPFIRKKSVMLKIDPEPHQNFEVQKDMG